MKSIKSIKDILNKVMYILNKEQKIYGLILIFLSFIGALLETLGVSAIVPLINALMTPEKILENEFVGNVFNQLHITEGSQIIMVIGGGVIILYILKNVFFVLLSWIRAKYASKIQRELSIRMMKTYMDKGYSFFLDKNTGMLMRGVFNDTNGVYSFINQMFKMVIDCLTVVLICIFILMTDWLMAVSMVILSCLCMLIVSSYFKNKMKKLGEESRKYGAIVNQQAIQAFQGIKEVIVMRKQKHFVGEFESANRKQRSLSVGQTVGAECPAYIIEAICITGLLGIVCFRMILGEGDATEMFPVLSAFAVGAFRILPSLGKLASGLNTLNFYLPFLNDMHKQIKGTESEHDNLKNIYKTDSSFKGQDIVFNDELKVDKISWKYDGATEKVLDNLSLSIKKGESVALIGHSGAGKTTLADIMLGLLKPQQGNITIDGRDIFTFGEEWSSVMGYVPQSVYLTDDTIKKNIAFGMKEKDIDENRVWAALEQAQLKEFVEELDEKLETKIGERGIRFSGGQRQRVAIARALYANPDILILDEATAALDTETETAVMESIEALKGKVTLIIIAHRLTTIRKCDKIYEVKDGNIVSRDKEEIFEKDVYEENTK